MDRIAELTHQFSQIESSIREAEVAAHRPSGSVHLLAVSKTKPA
ncbi:MAG: YggS family pyridoxal phosphate enzyme, partial [Gammaproteobacteria bacterium]